MEASIKSLPVPVVLPPISTCVPLFPRNIGSNARHTPPPPPKIPTPSKTSPIRQLESPIKREQEEENVTHKSGETPLRGHHDFDNKRNATPPSESMRAVSPSSMDEPYISSQKCKLTKCCVCERGVPESFSHAKPISWYAVCRLTMWALSQDGTPQSRKWFSLGRDICPFVEAHKWICGREFTTNWRTTIGITMSSSVKKGLFVAGNPNELGLGYYSLVDDSSDPYSETVPQPVGRVYKAPSSVGQSSMSSFQIIPVLPSQPSTPTDVVEAVMNLSTPHDVSTTPLKKRKILPGESVHRVQRQNKERKHTTDAERQLLMEYYDKYNTCTTCPEFTELMNRLNWDYHRTKIWLYNRKTYKQVRPGEKKPKRHKGAQEPNYPTNNIHNENKSMADTRIVEDESGDEFFIDDDESPQPDLIPATHQNSQQSTSSTRNDSTSRTSTTSTTSSETIEIHDSTGIPIAHHPASTVSNPPTTSASSTKPEFPQEYVQTLEKTIDSLRKQLTTEKQARIAAINQCMIKDDHIVMVEQALAKLQKGTSEEDKQPTDRELLLLRQQVEMYCRELREEKQRRSEQEMRAFDHLAQINVLTLRNLQLEKALKTLNGSANNSEPNTNNSQNHNTGALVEAKADTRAPVLAIESVGGNSKQ